MEVFLEQFIPSDKSKKMLATLKNVVIAMIILGLLIFFWISPIIGLLVQIVSIAVFVSSYFSFVDYEYELFNGNIDISKIYSGTKRKLVQKISNEDIEYVYESSNITKEKNKFFNSNLKGLKIYTFEFKGGKKVQLALNEELEKIVKIVYRSKIEIR